MPRPSDAEVRKAIQTMQALHDAWRDELTRQGPAVRTRTIEEFVLDRVEGVAALAGILRKAKPDRREYLVTLDRLLHDALLLVAGPGGGACMAGVVSGLPRISYTGGKGAAARRRKARRR